MSGSLPVHSSCVRESVRDFLVFVMGCVSQSERGVAASAGLCLCTVCVCV